MTTSPSRYPITTTLNRIWACEPCEDGKIRAREATGKTEPDDEPITYAAIVEAVGLEDALWCTRAESQYNPEWRLFAVWCARRVQHLMDDPFSIDALGVAERHATGHATDKELATAREAALDTAWAAGGDAAWVATYAARANAWSAASSSAYAVARAASAAAANTEAARVDAWNFIWEVQRQAFLQLVTTGVISIPSTTTL